MSDITSSKLKQIRKKLKLVLGYEPYISVEKLELTIEIPPNHAEHQPIQAKMSLHIGQISINDAITITVLKDQIWVLADIYVTQPLDIDGTLLISQNTKMLSEVEFPPLNVLSKSNQARNTLLLPLTFRPEELLSIMFKPLKANNSTSTVKESATIELIVIDFTDKNLPAEKLEEIAKMLQNSL